VATKHTEDLAASLGLQLERLTESSPPVQKPRSAFLLSPRIHQQRRQSMILKEGAVDVEFQRPARQAVLNSE
ncbi:hypothetical protein ACJRO7_015411, partial [Eucalyptus globulus]